MSELTIAPYFPFRRIKIINQSVDIDATEASIELLPHKRFKPVCHRCGHKADTAHSWAKRQVRDLNIATAKVWLKCHYRKLYCWANKAIDKWCALARSIKQPSLTAFAKMLERHRYGIVNHCDYPIHNGKIEGINNKIKVIKRKAYGFHDLRYFALKIYQVFSN